MGTIVSFGYWIRRQRKALDLTQQVVAECVSCSLAAIKKFKSDVRRTSSQIAGRLAKMLDLPTSQREIFLDCAHALRSIDQFVLAQQPAS